MNYITKHILKDHIKANQFASIYRFAISLIISIVLVKSGLEDDEVGDFEYVILLAYTFSFFVMFAYSNAILSRVLLTNKVENRRSFSLIFYQLLAIGLVLFLFTFFVLKILSFGSYISLDPTLILPISFYVLLLTMGIIPETWFLQQEDTMSIFTFSLVNYSVQLLWIVTAVFYDFKIETIFWGYILWLLGRLLYSIVLIKPRIIGSQREHKKWLIFTLPLFFHFILGSGMDYLDGHLVAHFFDSSHFLYYRYGARELPFSILLINALSAGMIGVLAKDFSKLKGLRNRINSLMNYLFPVSIIFMFISPFLFQFVYDDTFVMSAMVFNIYMLIISSRILVPHVILYAKGDNKALMYYSATELAINFILSLVLLNFWGLVGIPLATVIAFICNRLIIVYHCKRNYRINMSDYIDIKKYFFWMVLLFVGFFVSWYLNFGF